MLKYCKPACAAFRLGSRIRSGGVRMYCPECDRDELQGKFCSECGERLIELPVGCSRCDNQEASGNFCNMCGESLTSYSCVFCKAPNQTGSFCGKCGEALSTLGEAEVEGVGIAKSPSKKSSSWAVVYCTAHDGNSNLCGDENKRVTQCSYCGAEASNLQFES